MSPQGERYLPWTPPRLKDLALSSLTPPACHSACVGRHSLLLTRSPRSHLVPQCRLQQLPPVLLSLGSSVEELDNLSATTRELAKALRDLASCLPVPMGSAKWAIDEAKAKINATTFEAGLVAALPHQFQSDIREYLKTYCVEVESLASAHSMLSKLRKHKHAKLYPAALNSIKSSSIQFLHAFVNSLTTEGHCGAYSITSGSQMAVFELSMDSAIKAFKDEVLKCWTSEKDKEVTFLESKASVATATSNLEGVMHAKHVQLKACYDYLIGTSSYDSVMRDVDAFAAILHALSATIITKVNSLVLDKEDKKLEIAIKKMALEKPAQAAGSQVPDNNLLELKKMVADLSKKVELSSKKVCNILYCLLCVCGGHLSLTHPLLESLLTGLVEAGWEEVGWEEKGEGEGKGCHHRKTEGQEGPSRHRCQVQGQRQGQGRRLHCQVKAAGWQEEGWQEVSATFGLCFGTDSASARLVSRFGLYDFFQLYDLDWTLLASTCHFLCSSFSPSILLNPRLRSLVQVCCLVFVFSTASPKINIFDHTTYPDLVVRVEQDLLFMVMSRFAPKWLLGCRRFTNRLHSNLEIELPQKVVDTFSAGLKYLSPIAMKKSLVKDSWSEFCDRALKSWGGGYYEVSYNSFYREKDPYF